MLRAYARYARQIGALYGPQYMADTLLTHPEVARGLLALFRARFDPALPHRDEAVESAVADVRARIDAVTGLDADRILRSFLAMIMATLRTNWFRDRPFFSFKIDPSQVPGMPAPRPRFEIFVYSPRVEGVHLRFGAVARGGLRWSDRPAGLPHRDPRAGQGAGGEERGDRARRREGRLRRARRPRRDPPRSRPATARSSRALLDVTDNLVDGRDRAAARRRAPRRRRLLPRGRGRQGHREVLRHRQRGRDVLRVLAGRRVRLRRLRRLRPQGDGDHREGRVGERQAALPRAGRRHAARGVHRRRRRRHVRRRLRQRHAALPAHPAARGVRPPPRVRRPRSGRRDELRRARADVRAAPLVLGRLRPLADQRGRRRVAAHGEGRCRSGRRCAPRWGSPRTSPS